MRQSQTARQTMVCLLVLFCCCCLSGCLMRSPDELYALPQQSDSYYNLQAEIEKVVTGTVSYSAPTSGENRQPLQMEDLDGDGKNEAIVFAKDEGERPLKIFIFKQQDNSFYLASTIEGDGASFDSVRCIQMDGSPGMEIVVGRSISNQVQKSMSVYSLRENSTVELLSANYSAYISCDMDGDGRTDLFLVRFDTESQVGAVELYRYQSGVISRDPELSLSDGVDSIKQMIAGYTEAGTPAVFVSGAQEENLIATDVFAIRDGALQKIEPTKAVGSATVRGYFAYATDIDDDGLIELPDVETPPDLAETGDADAFRLIHWFNLGLDGTKQYKELTYHDYSAGFYVALDEKWEGSVTIARSDVDGGTAYTFSKWKGYGQEEEELFSLYLFSGDDRETLAQADGRFLLAEKNEVSYAASLGSGGLADGLTEELLKERFDFIHVDWNSGEM
ncbi:MAG: hypothetical protein VB055_04420 [Oscillospiraceae bacterium]|nr:hypothetical protein [Oscillospiraceae bacterium]